MPTYSKIPKKVKEKGSVACGRFCVFAGLFESGEVFSKLEKLPKKKNIPLVGYLKIKGKKYYYCFYGMVNDPDIYASR